MKFNFKKFFLVIALCTGFIWFMNWIVTSERNAEIQKKLDQKEIERESWSVSEIQNENSSFNSVTWNKY